MSPTRNSTPENTPSRVGEVIRARRISLGMSLANVADKAGCARSYIYAIEAGTRRAPALGVLTAIERALGLPRESLTTLGAWERSEDTGGPEIARSLAAARRLDELMSDRAALDEAIRKGQVDELLDSIPTQQLTRAGSRVPLLNERGSGWPDAADPLAPDIRRTSGMTTVPPIADPNAFAAYVADDSMYPEYLTRDLLVFSPVLEPVSGSDCLVRVKGGKHLFLARLFFESPLRLQALNPEFPSRVVARSEILGAWRIAVLIREI